MKHLPSLKLWQAGIGTNLSAEALA